MTLATLATQATQANVCRIASLATAAFLLTSCSGGRTPIAEPVDESAAKPAALKGPAAPIAGKTAYWEIYKIARTWATDIVPLSMKSQKVPGIRNDTGKAAMWIVVFASPSKHEVRSFSYAVAAADGVVKGVEAERAMAWGGPSRDAMPFRMADVGIDSDAAFQTAFKKSKAWRDQHPNDEWSMTLGSASRFPAPVWYVLWGNNKAGFNVWVNGTTGEITEGK